MTPTLPAQTHSGQTLRLRLSYILAALVVLASGTLTYRAASDFAASSRSVEHAYSVLEGVQKIEIRYSRTVSALRAYLVSGDTRFKTEYEATRAQIFPAIDTAIQLLNNDADQLQALRDLQPQMGRRLQTMEAGLLAYGQGGIPAVLKLNRLDDVREPDVAINALIERIKLDHAQILQTHITLDRDRLAQLHLTLFAFFAASLATLGLFYLRTRRHYQLRDAAEQESDRQRRFSDTIIQNAPMGVFIKETKGLPLIRVNRFVEEITGRSRDELLGKDDSQFIGAEAGRIAVATEQQLIARWEMLSQEEIQIDTPRGRRTLLVRKVLVPDESGAIAYLLGMSEDITDRRQAERGQQQFAESLERKGRELEAANKELESFSYSVSHDLRAPLRAVEGYAASLQEDYGDKLDAEGLRFLRNIREGATRMGQLIQDLLAFSRLGRQPLTVTQTDSHYLVQAAWETLRSSQPALRAELLIGELPPSCGDPRLLQQVWTNLLENAVKYTHKAEQPRIEITGEIAGTEAIFSIRDNGVGFDMRYYDKLFNVFQRLHSDTEYSGTGVGLAIVQRVIARHGGRVWAKSEPGKGATFSFALPVAP